MGRNNSMQKPSIVTRLKSDQAVAVGFISPALVVLSCVIAIPILRGIWTSFCDCSLRNLMSPTWAGLKNYIALFKKGGCLFMYHACPIRCITDPIFFRSFPWVPFQTDSDPI